MKLEADAAANEGMRLDNQFSLTNGVQYLLAFYYKYTNIDSMSSGGIPSLRDTVAAEQGLTALSIASLNTWVLYGELFTYTGATGNVDIRFKVNSASGSATNEILVDTLTVVAAGATVVLESEGISTDQSTWFDRSTNSLDGTISGAQGVLNPGNSIYFAKFTSVNARYWFLELNPDSLTYAGAYKAGQWDICKVFRPSTNPNLTDLSEVLNYDGIDTIAKYGGGTDLNERHGRRKVWQFTYTFFSETDRANFTNLLEQSKKRPFYFSLNADEIEPIIYSGRILGNPQIVPVAFERYSIQFEIIEEP